MAESFIVTAKTSPRANRWIAGYRALHLPFALMGTARRYRVALESDDATVVCVGRQERFRRLLTRVFGGRAQLEQVSPLRPMWNPDWFWPADAAVVAVELHPSVASKFRAAGWLICPEFVRWRGIVSQMPPADPSRSLRLDLRRIRRSGYALEEAAGSERDWDQFKREMLIPYAARRFGEKARIPVPALLRRLETHGHLLFLTKRGERVAGQAVLCRGDELWLAGLGVKDGDLTLLREGAVAGLYALTIEWAREQGVRHIDAGRSPAFKLDGLADYKRKWGMTPMQEPFSHLIAVRTDPAHEAVRLAIAREPFWIESEGAGLEIYPRSLLPEPESRAPLRL